VIRAGACVNTPGARFARTRCAPLLLVGLALSLSSSLLLAQEGRPHYRGFVLGSDLSSVSARVNVAASDATVVHARPALMQDLKWRPSYFVAGTNQPQTDVVEQIVFSFYDDQLFRLTIDYDRQRTEGMTAADMVAALSETYGSAVKPTLRANSASASAMDVESGVPISRWATDEYSVALFRSTLGQAFRVVVTSTALDALARTADAQAVRLDLREAPQRAIAKQKKDAEDARLSEEKTRATNKAAFRP
jgi:hypothetical protein